MVKFTNAEKEMGSRLKNFLKNRFPYESHVSISRKFGFANTSVLEWERGRSMPPAAYRRLLELGCDINELLTGFGEAGANANWPNRPLEAKPSSLMSLAVVGNAAADETQGARAGFFPPDADRYFDEVSIPETTHMVQIIGDSMAPVLLGGQYAFIGPEYVGRYDKPGNGEIVVADIQPNAGETPASRPARSLEGVFCKRVLEAGDLWVFLSINHTGTPFSASKADCRLWPVVGVWFAGAGRPPMR